MLISNKTSSYFVGSDSIAPENLGVGGHLYNNSNGMFQSYECGLGYTGFFPSSPYPMTDALASQYALSGTDPSAVNMC